MLGFFYKINKAAIINAFREIRSVFSWRRGNNELSYTYRLEWKLVLWLCIASISHVYYERYEYELNFDPICVLYEHRISLYIRKPNKLRAFNMSKFLIFSLVLIQRICKHVNKNSCCIIIIYPFHLFVQTAFLGKVKTVVKIWLV